MGAQEAGFLDFVPQGPSLTATATFTGHQCVDEKTVFTSATTVWRFLNGTVYTTWECWHKTRTGSMLVETNDATGQAITSQLVAPLPGNPAAACTAPAPTPSLPAASSSGSTVATHSTAAGVFMGIAVVLCTLF